jgi:hypothetical protein
MWILQWPKCHCDSFLSQHFGFPLSLSFHRWYILHHAFVMMIIISRHQLDLIRPVSTSSNSLLFRDLSNLVRPFGLQFSIMFGTLLLLILVTCRGQFYHSIYVSSKLYRVIKLSLCTWWLQYRKLHVLRASLLGSTWLLGSRPPGSGGNMILTLTPSVIPNSNYVIMVSDWNCLKYFCVLFCTVIIRCTETFWSHYTGR